MQWTPHPDAGRHPSEIPENERYYVLEEMYPDYGATKRHGNLVSRDVATRGIFFAVQQGFGIGGGKFAYLDITHLPQATKDKLAAILEIYEKFTGDDPREVPMKIFPAVHYSMGGMYTVYETAQQPKPEFLCDVVPDEAAKATGDPSKPAHPGMTHGSHWNMMTNIKGLYALGEVNYQYHGATRLGANALLSCIFDGIFCGLGIANYAHDMAKHSNVDDVDDAVFSRGVEQEKAKVEKLIATATNDGGVDPYDLHRRLGESVSAECTVVRTQEGMTKSLQEVRGFIEEYKNIRISDTGNWTNQNVGFTRTLGDMLIYAEAMLLAGIERKESRGCHYCSDQDGRDDEKFLKTAVCQYDADSLSHKIVWEDVPTPLIEPRIRDYSGGK